MIVTTEQFWCPNCGRLPWNMSEREVPTGWVGGWKTITCRQCGSTEGDMVCRGDTGACQVEEGNWCRFHGNYTGENPHPHGRTASYWRQKHWQDAIARGEPWALQQVLKTDLGRLARLQGEMARYNRGRR